MHPLLLAGLPGALSFIMSAMIESLPSYSKLTENLLALSGQQRADEWTKRTGVRLSPAGNAQLADDEVVRRGLRAINDQQDAQLAYQKLNLSQRLAALDEWPKLGDVNLFLTLTDLECGNPIADQLLEELKIITIQALFLSVISGAPPIDPVTGRQATRVDLKDRWILRAERGNEKPVELTFDVVSGLR